MISLTLSQAPLLVHEQRQIWKSKWVASCLPQAEAALRKAERVVEAIDKVEGLENYRSVLDAAVACFLPELRGEIEAYYDNRSKKRLRDHAWQAIARFDLRIVGLVRALENVEDVSAIEAAIVMVRSVTVPLVDGAK